MRLFDQPLSTTDAFVVLINHHTNLAVVEEHAWISHYMLAVAP
jgi:hypothetical protein